MLIVKLRSSKVFRFIGILIVSISVFIMLAYASLLFKFDYVNTKSFYETGAFFNVIRSQEMILVNVLDLYKGKEKIVSVPNIKSSELVSEDEVKSKFKESNKNYEKQVSITNNEYDNLKQEAVEKNYINRISEIVKEREEALSIIKEHYYTSEDEVRKELEKDKEKQYKTQTKDLDETRMKYIVITDDDRILTNIKEEYSDYIVDKYKKSSDCFIVLRRENLDDSIKINESSYDKQGFEKFMYSFKYGLREFKDKKVKMMAFFVKNDDLVGSYISSEKANYDLYGKNSKLIGYAFKMAIVTSILGLAMLIFSKVKEESIIQKFYNWLYFELQIGIQVVGVLLVIASVDTIFYVFNQLNTVYLYLMEASLYIVFEYYLLLYLIGSIRGMIRNKKFKEKFFIYNLFCRCKKVTKEILSYKSTRFKFIIFAIFTLIFILISLTVAREMWGWRDTLFIVFILYTLSYFGCLFLYGFKFMKHLNKILDGT
ncbi:hypothetical protein SAMN02745163_04594, partial [Clostridium cavendishii DSM 21758]